MPNQTVTGAPAMRFCSRLIAGEKASAIGTAHA